MLPLEASDLALGRNGRILFDNLSFELAPGDGLLLAGPNGSGKSSLLRLLAGFIRPHAGEIRLDGRPVDPSSTEFRSQLHFIGHANAIKGRLTVRENLEFMTQLAGGGTGHATDPFAIADLFERQGRFLSAGQRRRLALSRLLSAPRPLWLLDEPGVGLDRASIDRLQRAIRDHRAAGGIVIAASHGDVALEQHLVLELGR
ncbi:MAG: heme ABC exporter ATP-binding protein CcmA [Geminicoccaceae bacterium]|nr:heme ABC exporter ATP-binding protein CcmA [Geminicoccaceae bacterium]